MADLPDSLAIPLGRSGIRRAGGFITEERLPELQGSRGRAVFRQMAETDPVIGAALLVTDMQARKVDWSVASAVPGDATADFLAGFVMECIDDMGTTTPWPDVISAALGMIPFGWSWLDTSYKQRTGQKDQAGGWRSQFDDGLIGWAQLASRAQATNNGWLFDEDQDRVVGWVQADPTTGRLYTLTRSRGLHFRTTAATDNPEGKSALRLCYRPWYFKTAVEELEAIGIERDLAGLPLAEMPFDVLFNPDDQGNADVIAVVNDLLRNVRRNETDGIKFPIAYDDGGRPLYKFSLVSSGGARQIDTDAIIARHDSRITMALLADFLMLGHEGTGTGLGSDVGGRKVSLFATALETFLDRIAVEFNTVAIPRLAALNGYDPALAPVLQHSPVEAVDLADVVAMIRDLAQAGHVPFPNDALVDHLYERAGVPAPGAEQVDL